MVMFRAGSKGPRSTACAAVGVALFWLGAWASNAGAQDGSDSSAVGNLPAPIFASIERAWVVGSADAVLEHFGKRKVFISLPEGGPDGGTYSRAQSYFIFKELFDATRTEEFSFVSIRQPEEQPQTAVGRAERTFRFRDSSRTQRDRIFVSLVREGDRWVIAEIKSVR